MALTENLGNVVGLIKSETAPDKTYVIWGHITNPLFPDVVVHKVWNGVAWVLLGASDGSPIGGTVTGGTAGSVLFVDGSIELAQDPTNFSYVSADHFLVNTPSFSAINSSSPLTILNDEVGYTLMPFSGQSYVDVNWSSYNGIIDNGSNPVVNSEVNDLNTGAAGSMTLDSLNYLLLLNDNLGNYYQHSISSSSASSNLQVATSANTIIQNIQAGYITPLYQLTVDDSVESQSFVIDSFGSIFSSPDHTLTNTTHNTAYFSIPFSGSKGATGTREVWNGIYEYLGAYYANFENSDTSTGEYSSFTLGTLTSSLSLSDGGTNFINTSYTVSGLQIYTSMGDGTLSSSSDHQVGKFEFYINGATDTKLTQTNQSLTFIPGLATAVSIFAVRNSANTRSMLNINGDGEVRFMSEAGSDLLRMMPSGAFALGLNATISNALSTDVLIGYNSSMGATGGERIAIGAGASCNNFYTVAVGRSSSVTGLGSNAFGMDLIVSASYSTLIGTNYNGWTTNNIDNSFMWTSGAPGTGNYQSFFINSKTNVVLKSQGQLTTGTHYDNTAVNVITIHNGTLPVSNIADAFQMGSEDIAAGNAAPYFLTENGDKVKIYSIGGWGTPTGTLTRTTFATYAGQDISAVPTEAEVQAIDDYLIVLSERLAAVISDIKTGHQLFKA
jgi:hypothetical protein